MTSTSRNTTSINPPDHVEGKKLKHILIVDDDFEVTETLKHALTREGYKVSVAADGNAGIAHAEIQQPDLLILDLMMPKRSGFLVLEYLRQSENGLNIPVIMITGNQGNRHREYAELLGVSDYIQKPFAMDQILGSVKSVLLGEH